MEVRRVRTPSGRRRDEITRLLPPWGSARGAAQYVENHTEDIDLRLRKSRDEKVSRACGLLHESAAVPLLRRAQASYVPLHGLSGYSFGESTLFASEYARRCAALGLPAAALVDTFSFAGVVEFAHEARRSGVKPLLGCTVELSCGGQLVLIARSRRGFSLLSQLITRAHMLQPRGFPLIELSDLEGLLGEVICLTGGDGGWLHRPIISRQYDLVTERLEQLVRLFGRNLLFAEMERSWLPWEMDHNRRLEELAQGHHVRCVAGGRITHAEAGHFPGQDVMACIDTLCMVDECMGRKPQRGPGQPPVVQSPKRSLNGERYLMPPDVAWERFGDRPDWLAATHSVAALVDDDVLPSRTDLPAFCEDAPTALRERVLLGARERYGILTIPQKKRLDLELNRIIRLGYSDHFLIATDFCDYARNEGILFSARGSVVDSMVAYCLGWSRIDAFKNQLHFERFLPGDGTKRPDIDIDFEAKHREAVRDYCAQKYGSDHVAGLAAYGAMCVRGIVREVGKAMAIPEPLIGFLAKRIHDGVSPEQLEKAIQKKPELVKSGIPIERFQWVFRLAEMLQDVPRNLRAHSSGLVISATPISHTVPLQPSATPNARGSLPLIQWDKRSSKYFFDKFDILCLRGQDVLSGVQREVDGIDVEDIPLDDPDTFRAFRAGELIGIPQSASPAMRQAHVRLQSEDLTDVSLVQAGIRPGVGGAVKINELIQRRRGLKSFEYEHPLLEKILGNTYGIVVFQEQVDQLLEEFCQYTPGEAEDIREKIHKNRREDYGRIIQDELIERMGTKGFSRSVAEHVFQLIAGFKGYGFAQGHALAFAEISIRSVYCQQNYPAEYFASLFNAQPAGYYGPCTLAVEARQRGVRILGPCVQRSSVDFSVEDVVSNQDPQLKIPNGGVRIGLKQIAGLSSKVQEQIVASAPYGHWVDFLKRVRPTRPEAEALVLCGALDALIENRLALLWELPDALRNEESTMFESEPPLLDHPHQLSAIEQRILERQILGMDIEHHLMAFERERVSAKGGQTSQDIRRLPPGTKAIAVGNPIRLRFPPTPSGKRVVFFDLQDETGILNVTAFDRTYQRDGHAIVCSPFITVIGVTQDRDGHTAFLAHRVFPYDPKATMSQVGDLALPIGVADFLVG